MENRDEIAEKIQEEQDPALNPEEDTKEAWETSPNQQVPAENGNEDKKWRAKLYRLNAEGGWDDLGTGYSAVNVKK